jgi:hypothetical protein
VGNEVKIAVLIRVFDRIEDLRCNLQIIEQTWKRNRYTIIVVSNGASQGYPIPADLYRQIDCLVELPANAGHLEGNAQLLLEGIKHIPPTCPFTLLLEADTWLYTDHLIDRYITLMQQQNLQWTSAHWFDKFYALATDFALVATPFIFQHSDLFRFGEYPECYIGEYLHTHKVAYAYIKENMPVHVPGYILWYPTVLNHERRFYAFPRSPMVTHHIEHLKAGMQTKKRYFNIVAQTDFFADAPVRCKAMHLFVLRFWRSLSHLLPKRSWYSRKRIRP